MHKQIIWSSKSVSDLENILDYLALEWDDSVALKFLDLIEVLLLQISIHPFQFPLIHKKLNIRKCVITKHNSLFYRNRKGHIEILRIYDTRQDPKKLEIL
jgi:plasmid stabilization system protein ParE